MPLNSRPTQPAGPSATAGNPALPGWYADPEIHIFGDRYWIYPTYSADGPVPADPSHFTEWQVRERAAPHIWSPFLRQTFLDAFSSTDLVTWTRHPRVLDVKDVSWAAYAMWAPSAVEHDGRYFLFFSANDIKNNDQLGGIGVAVSDRPEGPFRDAIGQPLIGSIVHGAQPIDQMVFRDDDGTHYLYYGGWKHCNVVRLSPDLTRLIPFDDGHTYKSITPSPDYVEGPWMLKRRGVYYLMWSEGEWTGPLYSVAYATAPTPLGPFTPRGTILRQDPRVARGAGHHSAICIPGNDDWYIVYHRRPLGETDGNHRQVAIDKMHFAEDGSIQPVVMTQAGVKPRSLSAAG
ncbi:beta-xylosidase [Pelomonas aquatica]|uniref:Beta-xylosidase n=1 Tax=Pelomonas aquatica TaxID=431058 RepID=A0ABU1Z3B8_9BURK|nr:glycoside hydrolase family 43 protein [Pelomonas aquatica]MDR7295112.1 beta-xylosidase [Pelomonas aquatica]